MSHLEDLVDELCPAGVAFVELGSVVAFRRGSTITKKDADATGSVPVVSGGRTEAYFHSESNRAGQTIVVAGSGAYAGFVSFWEEPVFVSDAFSIDVSENNAIPKFMYYFLKNRQEELHNLKRGSGVPHVYGKDLAKIRFPLVPIEVQQEIVRILDNFTELEAVLEAVLEAELEARKKQYEFYRDQLLTFPEQGGVRWVPMGDVAEVRSGWGFPNTEQGLLEGEFAFYKVSDMNKSGNEVLMSSANNYVSSSTITKLGVKPAPAGTVIFPKIGAAVATNKKRILSESSAYDNNVMGLIPKETISSRFLFHWMQKFDLSTIARDSGAVPSIRKTDMENLRIPVPDITVQKEIAGVLDKFDALVNDISIGLPAEIEARRRQYEYYRDKLLTFPELAA